MPLLFDLLIGFWIIIPAYAANGFAPLVRGTHAMDGGRRLRNKPLFGRGKTWEGFLFGVFVGVVFGLLELALYPYVGPFAASGNLVLPPLSLVSVFLVSLGAMTGDLIGSFLKRQAGIPRGEPVPLLDQLDFVAGAFLLVAPVVDLRLTPALLILAFTPMIHLTANLIGYKLGAKRVPW